MPSQKAKKSQHDLLRETLEQRFPEYLDILIDLVNIDTDIPSGGSNGYGGGAGASGDLAYWIIHSCEVLPTPADYSAENRRLAYDTWWDVFNGMHAVLSYRTQMFIADNAAGANQPD